MTTRFRRGLVGLIAATALAAGGLAMTAAPAAADGSGTGDDPYDLVDLPIDLIPCRTVVPPEGVGLIVCLEFTFDGGQAKFGSVDSAIQGPIKVRQAVGLKFGENGLEPVLIDESTSGGGSGLAFPTINVPGGILGNSALEPLNALLCPITCVTASIQPTAPLSVTDLNPDVLISAAFGGEPPASNVLAVANLPFQVQVNNLLLGTTCYIGSPTNPIDMHLPLAVTDATFYADYEREPNGVYIVWKADATDATFSIPAADGCGLLGVGEALEALGLGNPFNQLLNKMVGLPSPSGSNLVSLQGHLGFTLNATDGIPIPEEPEG